MCFAFDWKDDAVRLLGLTAEYPGYADTQSLCICIPTYPLNVSMYPRIHVSTWQISLK